MKPKCVNGVPYIRTDLATGMIQGIRHAVLGKDKTDAEIFAADQRRLEAYQKLLRTL